MLSKLSTKQCANFGTVSLIFWKSCSLSSRVFLSTCVRWYVFDLFDLGILSVVGEVYGKSTRDWDVCGVFAQSYK